MANKSLSSVTACAKIIKAQDASQSLDDVNHEEGAISQQQVTAINGKRENNSLSSVTAGAKLIVTKGALQPLHDVNHEEGVLNQKQVTGIYGKKSKQNFVICDYKCKITKQNAKYTPIS